MRLSKKQIGYIGGVIITTVATVIGVALAPCQVYTNAELLTAVGNASCESIVVHAGTYGGFTITRPLNISGDGAKVDGQIRIDGTSNVTISGFEINVSNRAGVYVQESSNITVSGNVIYTPTYLAQQTDGIYSQRNTGNIYEANVITIFNSHADGHDDGIQSYQDTDLIIRGNIIKQVNDKVSNAQGIYVTTPRGGNTLIYNNVVDLGNAQSNALSFRMLPTLGGIGTVEIYNNTVVGIRPYHGVWVTETDAPKVINNIVFLKSGAALTISGSGQVSNNVTTDPKLTADYKPTALSTSVIDKGIPTQYAFDLAGVSRPQGAGWDVGAYEFVQGVTPSTNTATIQPQTVSAFPNAQGFGAGTTHGRGGAVIEVTNLNDSGTGSLRAAVSQSGARIIVFNVSGTINLTSHIKVDNPYIYIAGQSSPNGIQLVGAGIKIRTHDVLIRGLMIRPGNGSWGAPLEDRTGIIIHNDKNSEVPYNIVIDHNSVQWGTDETASTYLPVHDVTFSYNIFAEGLHCAGHPDGCHSMGLQIASGANNVTVYGNLIANNDWRNPLIGNDSSVEVLNNVLYGWGAGSVIFQGAGSAKLNVIGNYNKPAKCSDPEGILIDAASPGDKLYTDDWTQVSGTSSEIAMIRSDNPAFIGSGIPLTDKATAYQTVLALAGARNDPVDLRVKNNVETGLLPAGRCFIDTQSEVGGWSVIPAGTYADTDKDGMPNAWEAAHGLDPNNAADGKAVNVSGYSNLETYLDGLIASSVTPIPTVTPSPTGTATLTATASRTPAPVTIIPTFSPTVTRTATVTSTKTTTATTLACVPGFKSVDVTVQINTYPKSLNLREDHSLNAKPVGYLYSDPGIRHAIIGVWTDCTNYWASLNLNHWFALKLNGVWFTDWRP